MMRNVRSDRPVLITTAAESPTEEMDRRKRRYAVMATIFIASFCAAAVLHRATVLALLLCGVAMTTVVAAVIGANIRSPRRWPGRQGRLAHDERQLQSAPIKRPGGS